MIRSVVLMLFALSCALFGAEDTWTRVQNLKTGTELRVFKKNVHDPVTAQYGDATETSLIIFIKNKQSAIAKEEIDRIDYRPAKGTKANVTTTAKTEDPAVNPKTPYDSRVPSTSYSTTVGNSGKPDFETIYERPRSAGANK